MLVDGRERPELENAGCPLSTAASPVLFMRELPCDVFGDRRLPLFPASAGAADTAICRRCAEGDCPPDVNEFWLDMDARRLCGLCAVGL